MSTIDCSNCKGRKKKERLLRRLLLRRKDKRKSKLLLWKERELDWQLYRLNKRDKSDAEGK